MKLSQVSLGLLLILTAFCLPAVASLEDDPFPDFSASAYLVKSGKNVLWSRNADTRLPPASITKIMTALLAIRKSRLEDVATVTAAAANETGSRLRLRRGEKMYVGFLLAAMLLNSANDACHVLADHVAGSEKLFVEIMNREAQILGMRNTHFTNACGHDHPDHLSTARDLVILTEAALKESVFSDLVSTVSLDIKTIGNGRTFRLQNKNELVGRYPGTIGVKTGFTNKAGKCLVALVEQRGTSVLLVVLNASNRWWGSVDVLNKAFARASKAQPVETP